MTQNYIYQHAAMLILYYEVKYIDWNTFYCQDGVSTVTLPACTPPLCITKPRILFIKLATMGTLLPQRGLPSIVLLSGRRWLGALGGIS